MQPFAFAPVFVSLIALAGLASGCATTRVASPKAVELTLESAKGEPVSLATTRGRPLLLYFFATYDTASQLALSPLAEATKARAGMQVLGIAVQPHAESLIGLFGESLGLEFPLAYDPDGLVLAGKTAIGDLPGVPYYVWLDGAGHIAATHRGPLLGEELGDFLDDGPL